MRSIKDMEDPTTLSLEKLQGQIKFINTFFVCSFVGWVVGSCYYVRVFLVLWDLVRRIVREGVAVRWDDGMMERCLVYACTLGL